MSKSLEVVAADPGVDVIMLLQDMPRVTPDFDLSAEGLAHAAGVIRASSKPVVVVGNVLTDVSEVGRRLRDATDYPQIAGGIEHGMTALGNAVRWSETYRRHRSGGHGPIAVEITEPAGLPPRSGSWTERHAAEFLSANGIPMVPSRVATSPGEAAQLAADVGFPVVLKAAADDLEHKSDLGGVVVGLDNAESVRRAALGIADALDNAGHDGSTTIVQPMRSGGTELLVGVVRDPAWGLTLAVALGGVWVELLDDSSLRLLPISADEARRALLDLRGAGVLRGARGQDSVDLDALAAVVARIGALAVALGDQLESLEVNPLLVSAERIEALDALITWRG